MRVVRDLCGKIIPAPFDMIYNTNTDGNGTTARYKGSLCKIVNFDDVDKGYFVTFAGETDSMENVIGILEEDVAASTTYGLEATAATGNWVRKKITPIGPTTVIRAEYVQKDAAAVDNRDTGATGSAASTSLTTAADLGAADWFIGGWFYFLTGNNAGYLHYCVDNANTTGVCTLRTALVNAVASGDYFLCIAPPFALKVDFNATYTDIKSETVIASMTDEIIGIDYWIKAPGIGMEHLTPSKHDGIKIANARFYHDFCLTFENVFTRPIRA